MTAFLPSLSNNKTHTHRDKLLMSQTFLLDAGDFAGDLMPAAVKKGEEEEDQYLNLYLVRTRKKRQR